MKGSTFAVRPALLLTSRTPHTPAQGRLGFDRLVVERGASRQHDIAPVEGDDGPAGAALAQGPSGALGQILLDRAALEMNCRQAHGYQGNEPPQPAPPIASHIVKWLPVVLPRAGKAEQRAGPRRPLRRTLLRSAALSLWRGATIGKRGRHSKPPSPSPAESCSNRPPACTGQLRSLRSMRRNANPRVHCAGCTRVRLRMLLADVLAGSDPSPPATNFSTTVFARVDPMAMPHLGAIVQGDLAWPRSAREAAGHEAPARPRIACSLFQGSGRGTLEGPPTQREIGASCVCLPKWPDPRTDAAIQISCRRRGV